MKKVITLLLAAGLVIGAASAANAVDIKAKGLWHNAMSFADRNFEKHNGSDKMQNATRIRTQIDVIASESLKGVVYFEIGPQNWGKGADGASLGTDGKVVKVRYNYVDWVIPQTDAKVRMGLQNFSLPGFALPNVILGGGGADGAGIPVHQEHRSHPLLAARRKRQHRQRHRLRQAIPLQRRHGLHGHHPAPQVRRREGDPVGHVWFCGPRQL